jgi:hypothetical protein
MCISFLTPELYVPHLSDNYHNNRLLRQGWRHHCLRITPGGNVWDVGQRPPILDLMTTVGLTMVQRRHRQEAAWGPEPFWMWTWRQFVPGIEYQPIDIYDSHAFPIYAAQCVDLLSSTESISNYTGTSTSLWAAFITWSRRQTSQILRHMWLEK